MICPSLQEFWFAIFSFFSRSPNKSANNPLLVIFFIFQVIFTGTDKQCYPAHIDTGSENTHMGNFFFNNYFLPMPFDSDRHRQENREGMTCKNGLL